jgi:uncharacterized MAPEG superfamily protein
MDQFAEYGHALASIAGMVILWAVINPLSTLKKEAQGVVAGGELEADYANPAYRWHRAYQNLTEVFGVFCGIVIVAILAGANPFWVNLLASVFLLSRIAVVFVHVRGIGKPNGGLRSMIFVFGWALCIALAVFALIAVF